MTKLPLSIDRNRGWWVE